MGESSSWFAIDPAREPHAQGAGIELVGLAFAVERHGRDETLRPGFHQPAMEDEVEAAGFLDGRSDQTFGDPFLHLEDELIGSEFAPGPGARRDRVGRRT